MRRTRYLCDCTLHSCLQVRCLAHNEAIIKCMPVDAEMCLEINHFMRHHATKHTLFPREWKVEHISEPRCDVVASFTDTLFGAARLYWTHDYIIYFVSSRRWVLFHTTIEVDTAWQQNTVIQQKPFCLMHWHIEQHCILQIINGVYSGVGLS